MKNIEERVKASFRSIYDKALFPVHLDGYRSGETDQQKIDTEKACADDIIVKIVQCVVTNSVPLGYVNSEIKNIIKQAMEE